ncbi:ABC transporter ATP-binding protein [Brevibacterium sp. 91QC2O2]|uniref:ATP-binding cassette domain-containing protein n=1 Tax=Brevibacterium TaxID=1696 RepID=UPI00211C4A27|nr:MULTISPECIES: ABC transporter ATP-binding protein [unclassified Brevibacterium]MCQ9369114.1 ABC transporter ATP-binding protein [Brevibacterium sp. 91QC2O2]MCQ9386471.1 ABC transporter ATP-binding protein [Brevibacterium sp. 68QC2CO]
MMMNAPAADRSEEMPTVSDHTEPLPTVEATAPGPDPVATESQAGPEPQGSPEPEPMINAEDLGMRGKSPVFEHVDAQVPAGGMLVIIGPEGTGKTALLLSLTGRMKFTHGHATVAGIDVAKQPRRVRSIASLGPVKDVTDLDDNLTIEHHVAERIIMYQPWYKPFASKQHVARALEVMRRVSARVSAAIQPEPGTPEARTASRVATGTFPAKSYVGDLSDLDRFLLGLALALFAHPQVVAVDDIDLLRRREDRQRAWMYVLAGMELLGIADPDATSPTDRTALPAPTFIVSCEDASELAEARERVLAQGLTPPPLVPVRLSAD